MEVQYRYLTWEEAREIWVTKLWPGRDDVEPITSMKYLGGYDLSLKNEAVHFLGATYNDIPVGVNSYTRTGKSQWRSRGLWVDKEWRRLGVASGIMRGMFADILNRGGTTVWTLPRQDSYGFYAQMGFIQTTPYNELDWGHNCYALASVRTLTSVEVEAHWLRDMRQTFYREVLEPMVENGESTEMIRRAMKPLADREERQWRK